MGLEYISDIDGSKVADNHARDNIAITKEFASKGLTVRVAIAVTVVDTETGVSVPHPAINKATLVDVLKTGTLVKEAL